MMSIGKEGVRSVTANSWYFGHLTDQAGWLPSQKGHLGCSKRHLFGGCWFGHMIHTALFVGLMLFSF
jgi:hypothetical protein